MNVMTRVILLGGTLALISGACGVEPIEEDGPPSGIPPVVQAAFDRSCASMTGCHEGTTAPNLSPGASGQILSLSSSKGPPYVVLGDIEGSYMASALLREDGVLPMPPTIDDQEQEQDVAVILGWIAGAPLSGPEGEEDEDEDEDEGEEGDDAEPSDGAFAPIQSILTEKCSGAACHNNFYPPQLTEGAYDNIVDEENLARSMPYVTPGDLEQSYLWRRINGPDYGLTIMPPETPADDPPPPLTDDERAAIEAWIEDGAMP